MKTNTSPHAKALSEARLAADRQNATESRGPQNPGSPPRSPATLADRLADRRLILPGEDPQL
jgi:hypothetical protein